MRTDALELSDKGGESEFHKVEASSTILRRKYSLLLGEVNLQDLAVPSGRLEDSRVLDNIISM